MLYKALTDEEVYKVDGSVNAEKIVNKFSNFMTAGCLEAIAMRELALNHTLR